MQNPSFTAHAGPQACCSNQLQLYLTVNLRQCQGAAEKNSYASWERKAWLLHHSPPSSSTGAGPHSATTSYVNCGAAPFVQHTSVCPSSPLCCVSLESRDSRMPFSECLGMSRERLSSAASSSLPARAAALAASPSQSAHSTAQVTLSFSLLLQLASTDGYNFSIFNSYRQYKLSALRNQLFWIFQVNHAYTLQRERVAAMT